MEARDLVSKLSAEGQIPNLAALYSEFSLLYFVKSHYDEVKKTRD